MASLSEVALKFPDDTEKVDAQWCAFPQIPRMREDQTDTCDAEVYCLTVFSTS
jgi:hypothetical protein